jgi:diketogulonate reductase-like aldo/keto reductase
MKITDIKGTFSLSNGVKMPYLGLGVFLSENGEQVINAVNWALEKGYRHIDTAAIYRNEEGVGQAVNQSSVPREDIFVVSKVWNSDQGYESTLRAYEQSLERLQLDYLDLYLIHWPVEGKFNETWKAMEEMYNEGRIRAIGVSNFMRHHLDDLISKASILPMVNQMEFHPYLVQQELLNFCKLKGIQYEGWSPFMQGKIFNKQELSDLAEKYGKTLAQLVLRWNLQKGVVSIPKSSKKHRIISNADIFDFEISEEDMNSIDALDNNTRVGPDPDNFNF